MQTLPVTMPDNCIEVNGYWICRDGDLFHLYDPKQRCWFGFNFGDLEHAKRACNALAGNQPEKAARPVKPKLTPLEKGMELR